MTRLSQFVLRSGGGRGSFARSDVLALELAVTEPPCYLRMATGVLVHSSKLKAVDKDGELIR